METNDKGQKPPARRLELAPLARLIMHRARDMTIATLREHGADASPAIQAGIVAVCLAVAKRQAEFSAIDAGADPDALWNTIRSAERSEESRIMREHPPTETDEEEPRIVAIGIIRRTPPPAAPIGQA